MFDDPITNLCGPHRMGHMISQPMDDTCPVCVALRRQATPAPGSQPLFTRPVPIARSHMARNGWQDVPPTQAGS